MIREHKEIDPRGGKNTEGAGSPECTCYLPFVRSGRREYVAVAVIGTPRTALEVR